MTDIVKPAFISSAALSEATRSSLARLQGKLAVASQELSSGRHADIGEALGLRTGETVSLRQEHAGLAAIIDANGLVAARLDATQDALEGIVDLAQRFLGSLIGAQGAEPAPRVLVAEARTGLAALGDMLNAALDGQYLFAGLNADAKPFADYFATPASAGRTAIAAAFTSAFGMTQTDPAVATIDAAPMQGFLDTAFATEFADPAWGANWSAASAKNVQSRISRSERVETSTNVNEAAFRQLASALTMVADLGLADLNEGAANAVIAAAVRQVGEAIGGLAGLQAALGVSQERVAQASARMSIQIDVMTTVITGLEAVDPAEAATRVSMLTQQIETAYALTGRLHRLSLLDFL
jgi:flagellar hook-associated protein 3 FlgL